MPVIDTTAKTIDISTLLSTMNTIRQNIHARVETGNQADTFIQCRQAEFDLRSDRTTVGTLYRGDAFVESSEDTYRELIASTWQIDLDEWPFPYIDWEAAIEEKLGEMGETTINDELYYYESR